MKSVVTRTGLQPVIPAPTANQPLNGANRPTVVGRVAAITSNKGLQPVTAYKRRTA